MLFETIDGAGELVSAYKLRELVQRQQKILDVVVVAACKSESVGEIFLKCGARHVVCIKTGMNVLDKAAISFTGTFYREIFNGKQVCTAFENAKASVDFNHNEYEGGIFQLLVKEQLPDEASPLHQRASM